MSSFSMPDLVEPMSAATGELPETDAAEWALEIKWDGVRVVTYLDGKGGVRATARRGTEVTSRYPELSVIGDLIPHQRAVLDGEVVAFDRAGRPDFERLQRRMHVGDPHHRLIREVPVHYVVFDLLYLDGHTLYDVPYRDRRELLAGLELTAGPIEAPSYLRADDAEQVTELVDYTREQRLEGLVAKRLDPVPARPARRLLAQGEERPDPGGRHRRLETGPGPARGRDRLVAAGCAREEGAAVRGPCRHRLHRPGAGGPRRVAPAAAPCHQPVRFGAV
jgi:bifunctional non-homologous end joining protein LigD